MNERDVSRFKDLAREYAEEHGTNPQQIGMEMNVDGGSLAPECEILVDGNTTALEFGTQSCSVALDRFEDQI